MKFEMSLQPLILYERMLCQLAEWPGVCIHIFFLSVMLWKYFLVPCVTFLISVSCFWKKTHTQNPHLPLWFVDLLFGRPRGDSLRIGGPWSSLVLDPRAHFACFLSSSVLGDALWAAWGLPVWESLHLRYWHAVQTRPFFPPEVSC